MPSRYEIEVSTTIKGTATAAGTLFAQNDKLTFRYNPEYLANPNAYDLAPSLPRTSTAPFFFNGLGPFSDSAPDRWGRRLLNRALKRTRVSEMEYLLGVNDLTRQGSLRYAIDGVAQADDSDVPVLTDLPGLLDTADAVGQDRDVPDVALRRLYRATGSLGGARPKASVYDSGRLWMAKFPKPNGDDWDVIGWEAVTLDLANLAGLCVPNHRALDIEDVEGCHRTVLLTERFDREPSSEGPERMRRIPYISAMTALGAKDGEGGDWLDLAEYAQRAGCDMRELWRRAAFGAAIGNCDDHLRNHGFLREGNRWSLSPAFDLNPEPFDAQAEDVHQLTMFGEPNVTVALMLQNDVLNLFSMPRDEAVRWCATLHSVLARAVPMARMKQLDSRSIEIMNSRFERAQQELDATIR